MSTANRSLRSCRPQHSGCSRRQFVLAGGLGTATLLLGKVFPGRVRAGDEPREVSVTPYPRQRVTGLSVLKVDQVVDFAFPEGQENASAMLVKLGTRAGGGIGPEQDIVAFSTHCTHMGGDLQYNTDHKLAACGEHLTTFDLTRHGMVVAGHATESLPQIILEVEDDEVVAVGIVGLLYGHHANPVTNNQGK